MSDPSDALQRALVAAFRGNAVGVGDRVYDRVPDPKPPATSAIFPYVTVGDSQVLGDDDDCGEASEVFMRTHAWSRAAGYPEVKAIAGLIRSVLRTVPLVLPGFTIVLTEFLHHEFLRDPDGITRHAVVEHRFLITHS